MSVATLNGHRVTSGRVNIPGWGFWTADVTLDEDVSITGRITLKIADLELSGTVLSGGPMKGRSVFQLVAGAGGWRKTLPAFAYADDGSTKAATVLGDAARAVGETMAEVPLTTRVGAGFTRPEGPASQVLQLVSERAWYVDNAGVTQLGARPAGALVGSVTRITPVDLSRGKVVLAGESIATILPGLVVDGLTAVDVQHDITTEGGLRSTVWGSTEPSELDSFRALLDAIEPDRKFRGVTEYRVVTLEGDRLNLQPVRVSSGMPDLRRVSVRPGVPGCSAEATLGALVLVAFVDADRARPVVVGWDDVSSGGFQPSTLMLRAGGQVGTEHVATVEGTVLFVYNVLVALMAAAGGGPLLAAVLQPLLGTAIGAALTAQSVAAPPGEAAQLLSATTFQAGFAAGTTPSPAMFAAWTAAINAISTSGSPTAKTANVSGAFPSLGCAAVEAG